MDVVIYSTDRCPFCLRAKALLDRLHISYQEINLGRDPSGREQLVAQTGLMTFPQIIVDGQLLGGFDQLAAAVKAKTFPPSTTA